MRRKLLASLCAALGLAVLPAVTQAAATAKWTVAYYVPPQRTGEIIEGIAATGTGSAWAIAQFGAPPTSKDYSSLYRWDGKAWTPVATSGPLRGYGFSLISASSASNVVAVGRKLVGCCKALTGQVVRWNGAKWTVLPPVPTPAPESLLTFGASDTWVAALTSMYHWNGHSWKSYRVPGSIVAISGAAPDQVWGVGTSHSGTQPEIVRWNGAAWTVADRLPAVPKTDVVGPIAVTADSGRDAWVTGYTQNTRTFASAPFLLHWDGKAWQPVKIPSSVHGVLSDIETDGSGGFWAASSVLGPSGFGIDQKMAHYSAGKWTALPVPAIRGARDNAGDMMPTPQYLANVPGTTSMWGSVLYVVNSIGAPDSVIVRYLP